MAKRKQAQQPGSTRCTADNPMPHGLLDDNDQPIVESQWTHPDMRLVYEGSFFDTFACPHCGREYKAAKRR